MLRSLNCCAALLAVGIVSTVVAPIAQAAEISFRFTNHLSSPVWVKLFSSDRLKDWPDDGRLFILADSSPRNFSVGCELGERICYGAWIEGDITHYWGSGNEGKFDCDNCCTICEIPAESPLYQVTFR
ncbi:MAG: hypothetical protein AB3N20_22010 [Rhizobiaceae bacterium]